jgi:hypothetical protein
MLKGLAMTYPGICLMGLRKTTKDLSQTILSSGRYLNSGPPEYEAGVQTTGRDVQFIFYVAMNMFHFIWNCERGISRRLAKTLAYSGKVRIF